MKKLCLTIALSTLPFASMAATILGFQVGTGNWDHSPSGTIRYQDGGTGTSADLVNDLGLTSESEGYVYALLEHPVPLVPNVKIMNTSLSTAGTGTVSANFTFGGTVYTVNTPVTSNIRLDQTDYTLYYEILDNVVSFDVGLTLKEFDGEATINSVTAPISGGLPMIYAAAEVVLPAGFAIGVEGNMLSLGDSEISDITAKVTYTSDYYLGVEAGVRTLTVKLDNVDQVYSNIQFDGVFAGVFFKF